MHMVEKQYKIKPLMYARYVDDVLAVFNDEIEAENFFQHINTIHKNIKFTQEKENGGKLVFLDIEIIKSSDGILTKWHLKATNTGTYLNKSAYSPSTHKIAAMRALIYRALRICSSNELFEESYEQIENIFINNGYHHGFINKIKRQVIDKFKKQPSTYTQPLQQEQKQTKYLTLTYVRENEQKAKKVTKLIEEVLGKEKVNIRIAYKSRKTQAFFANKDKVAVDIQSNVVYMYNCVLCKGPKKYIGESTRHFITRKREHITGDKGPTEVSTHVHPPNETFFSIITRTKHTLIGESLVYHSIPAASRLNQHHPPYQLNLFNCDSHEEAVINNA